MKQNIRVLTLVEEERTLLYEGVVELVDNNFVFYENGTLALTEITFTTSSLSVKRNLKEQETNLYLSKGKTSLEVVNGYGCLPIKDICFLSIKVDKNKKRYNYFYQLNEKRCILIELL